MFLAEDASEPDCRVEQKVARAEPVDTAPLHAKIGQLALEIDFLESALTKARLLSAK
jgi:hypothetical protein